MEYTGNDDAGSAALVLSGSLDVRRTAEVRAQVYALLNGCVGDVVVDVSRVDSIDMTTLKLLAVANLVAEREGRRVVLRGASPAVRRLMHFAHLRSQIPVEPLEAVAAQPPREPPSAGTSPV
jgi:anti-anti-sigma factor